MDLDEMKSVWSDLSGQLDEQKRLTQDLILKMTQEKSVSRLGRIIKAEGLGICVSLVMLVYLLLNFKRLDHWVAIAGGIGLTLILILGITFAFKIITHARKIDVLTKTYTEVIRDFDAFRALLRKYKKWSFWTAGFSVLFVIPVMNELILDKNLNDLEEMVPALLLGLLATPLILFVIIRFYSGNVSAVKKALNNIDFKD